VGVMQGSDYPSAAKKIPIIASFNHIDSEAILALHPDLIVAWSENGFVSQLSRLGIPVYLSHQRKITDIPRTMEKLACLSGTSQPAQNAIKHFQYQYERLQKKYAHKKNITVFYQVWPTPLMTITKNSWISDVIALCGGTNIFADLIGAAPVVNIEAVIASDPAVILGTGAELWRKWPKMTAVKHHHLFSINPDLIERASSRLLAGAKQLCELMEAAREGE